MRREATMDTMGWQNRGWISLRWLLADIKYFDTNTITKTTSKQMLCYNHKIEYVKAWTPIAPRPRQITCLLTSLCPLSVLCHKCDIWNQNLWAIFKDNKCPSLLAALAYKYTKKKAKYMFIIEHK